MTKNLAEENLPYAIDFDGVLAESIWPDRGIGAPIAPNIAKVQKLAAEGWRIVIHTARPWSDYEDLCKWLAEQSIPFDAVVCGKLLAFRYVDDRAINSIEEEW